MNEKKRKKTKGAPIPWDAIRFIYVTRVDRPGYRQLGREFGVAESTVGSRATKENWKGEREKHRNGVITKAQQKIEEKQTIDLAESIRVFERLLGKLISKTENAEPSSLEGLSREIRETIKTLNVYLVRPAERTVLNEEEMEELSEVLLRIKGKAPEEYEQLKEIYKGGDGRNSGGAGSQGR